MAEIFIREWNKSDHDGRRILSSKSAEKILGQHAYACQNLTSWFRLGKYIIKHDQANFLLGLIREIGTDNVKSWERDEQEDRWVYKYHVDDIVRVVNRHFSGNDYVLTLLMLQEELKGYENCYYICACYHLDFDYVQFIKDKDVYQARLMAFAKKANEEQNNKEIWQDIHSCCSSRPTRNR